jgi:hypothetical protein
MALAAPVALYPAPLLAVVLAAALFPVDVVQAERFIERHAADQTLEPSPDWDPAVTALLAYPAVLTEMNEHLDWTQPMGDAVYDRLDEVQDAIQDLRQGAYAMGILASNEVQEVVVTGGIIEIRPIAPDAIAVPQYDGFALLGALEPVAAAPPADGMAKSADAAPELAEREASLGEREAALAQREAGVAEREQTETKAADEATAEPAPFETAAPAPDTASYAPAAPSYVEAPVYAAAPPPVTYAQRTSSFWGTTGAFIAGAAVGCLLGYAIFDDNDNGGGNNNRRNDITIEDSTIVIGGSGNRLDLDRGDRNASMPSCVVAAIRAGGPSDLTATGRWRHCPTGAKRAARRHGGRTSACRNVDARQRPRSSAARRAQHPR